MSECRQIDCSAPQPSHVVRRCGRHTPPHSRHARRRFWRQSPCRPVPLLWSVPTLTNATPIRAEGGAIRSVVVTMQYLAPLEDLERVRTEFLGLVSHELREPLAAVKGSKTTLLEEAAALDPAEMRELHRITVEQAKHMRGLIVHGPGMKPLALLDRIIKAVRTRATATLVVGSNVVLRPHRSAN